MDKKVGKRLKKIMKKVLQLGAAGGTAGPSLALSACQDAGGGRAAGGAIVKSVEVLPWPWPVRCFY